MSAPVPAAPDEPEPHRFAEPWQAEAFALAVALNQKQAFDWKGWVEVFSSQPGYIGAGYDETIDAAYYRRWLQALEEIAVGKGLVSAPEVEERVEAWRRAYLRTPHGQPIELARGLEPGDPSEMEHVHGHDHHAHHHHHPARAEPVSISPAVGANEPLRKSSQTDS